jgi:hypothetical protein
MYETIPSRFQQRCQISYYPEINKEIIFQLDWDDVEQVVILIQGTRYMPIRNENIEGDLTLRDILVQLGYGQCIIHLAPRYELAGMKIDIVMDTTVHDIYAVQLQIYRSMDVFDAMIPGWDVPLEVQDEWAQAVQAAQVAQVSEAAQVSNDDIDRTIPYDKDLNIDQIVRELEELALPHYDTDIVNYIHRADDIEYDSIAYRVAEFVLSE